MFELCAASLPVIVPSLGRQGGARRMPRYSISIFGMDGSSRTILYLPFRFYTGMTVTN